MSSNRVSQNKMASVPVLDVVVREEFYEQDILPVLELVRPSWPHKDTHFRELHGGLMNKLVGCRLEKDEQENDMVLIKIYGKHSSFVDRDNEILTMRVLHHVRCGEPVYCRFTNGMAYRYNPGVCLDQETIGEEKVARCVAKEMARLKASTIDWKKVLDEIGEGDAGSLFLKEHRTADDYVKLFLDQVPEKLSDPTKHNRLITEVMDKDGLKNEAVELQHIIEATKSQSDSLSHTDPVPQNMIYDKDNERVKFIDWEYGRFFPLSFDIGAFFAGFAIGFIVDESKYPSREYQLKWIRWFLEYKLEFEGKDPTTVTDGDVEEMFIKENKMALLYMFVGALWSLGQVEKSTIDFDFIGFGRDLLQVYNKRKAYALSL